MSDEEFGICPFDSSHHIVLFRMPAHIMKCRRNYRGPPMEQCVYNATHFVEKERMQDHLQQCKDCYRFNQPKYVEIATKSKKKSEH